MTEIAKRAQGGEDQGEPGITALTRRNAHFMMEKMNLTSQFAIEFA
jgi:hypothetical protein